MKFFTERKTQSFLDSIRKGDTQAARDSLKKLEHPNQQDKEGRTGLMVAAENNRKEILESLIAAGANLDLQDSNLKTALMLAMENGHGDICKILIGAGCNLQLRDQNSLTAFGLGNVKGHAALVRELICMVRPEVKKLLEEGPEDPNSRAAFQWLKQHEGIQVTASYNTSKEKFLADSAAWVIALPEVQLVGDQGEEPILEYRIGIWEFSPGNFKLPAKTASAIEIDDRKMTFNLYYRESAGLKSVATKKESNLWKSYCFTKAL